MLTKATVIGTGGMGTVVAHLLASNDVHVAFLARTMERAHTLLFDRENRRHLPGLRLVQRITPTADPAAALANSELIVSAIPCQFLRREWSRCAAHVEPGTPVCSVTKGVEIETMKRPSEIISAASPDSPVAVLSGPSVAPELARCLPATVVVACVRADIACMVQEVMSTSWFRVYTNLDVLGVELAGALKNIIALAAGILDGLRAGDNAKAALLTRGLVEITRLGVSMGAKPETFGGLAGVGDLVTTCVSPIGRNRSAGERIGAGVSPEQVIEQSTSVIEGIPTTRAVVQLAAKLGVEMPITRAVYEVLFERKSPIAAISELMSRPPKAEQRC
ncbi:MAG: NAD(P)-dependent glycerol-3-phosphate dehydrogenase [Phycisphaerae bacterium]|nr:NAD(P)-dependent glycerol-3-phosphate dehydrogenase [Phycisphaerae bacterium]